MNVLFLILPYIEVSMRSYFHYLILFFDSFLYIIYSDYPPTPHSYLLPISLSSLFIAVIKHRDQKQRGEAHLLQLTPYLTVQYKGKSRQEPGSRKLWKNTVCWLDQPAFLYHPRLLAQGCHRLQCALPHMKMIMCLPISQSDEGIF